MINYAGHLKCNVNQTCHRIRFKHLPWSEFGSDPPHLQALPALERTSPVPHEDGWDGIKPYQNIFLPNQRPKPPNQPQLSKFHGHPTRQEFPAFEVKSLDRTAHVKPCEVQKPWPGISMTQFHIIGSDLSDRCSHIFFSQVTMLKRHHSNISEDRLVKDGT